MDTAEHKPQVGIDACVSQAWEALKTVYDPEVGLDVVSMGLIYGVESAPGELRVRMTLTSRGCPLGDSILAMADEALRPVAFGRALKLDLVFDPPWTPDRISPEGRAHLMGEA